MKIIKRPQKYPRRMLTNVSLGLILSTITYFLDYDFCQNNDFFSPIAHRAKKLFNFNPKSRGRGGGRGRGRGSSRGKSD